MSIENYWMGKGISLEEVWRDFDGGKKGYIAKVSDSELHLLHLGFAKHPLHLPLFDHEAIYKTVKSTFHDVKENCLSETEYDRAAPIFLYRVDRGSAVIEFLAEWQPLLAWLGALAGVIWGIQKFRSVDIDIQKKKLEILAEFPDAPKAHRRAYLKAWTTWGSNKALSRLYECGLTRLAVSGKAVGGKARANPLLRDIWLPQ